MPTFAMDAVALTLRPADADDFDEIVKLSEGIYAGHDYLPLIFHQWLQRDNIVVILAHCGARLVGLEAYFVVDDGRTLIHRAGRVHPDYRGQGIFKQVGEYSIKHAKEHYANIQRKRFVSIRNTEIPDPRKLLELHIEAYNIGKEFCDKLKATALTNSMEIKTCAPDYFANIIESLPARLFTRNSILSNWCPFERLRSNVDHILRESTELYVEKCDDDVIPNSLSVGTLSPRVKYKQWVAEVYADSPDLFQAHIVHQLKRACELINDDFIFTITMQDESLSSLVRIIMKDQLKFKTADFFHNKTLRVYETDITAKSQL